MKETAAEMFDREATRAFHVAVSTGPSENESLFIRAARNVDAEENLLQHEFTEENFDKWANRLLSLLLTPEDSW